MKRFKTICMIVLMAIALPVYANDNDDVKVVYQCDFPDVDKVHLMLNSINNAVEYYNKNLIPYEIDVVAMGP